MQAVVLGLIYISSENTSKTHTPYGVWEFLAPQKESIAVSHGETYGAAPVQPGAGNSPPDCCFWTDSNSFRIIQLIIPILRMEYGNFWHPRRNSNPRPSA